jgi:hypothetical protein
MTSEGSPSHPRWDLGLGTVALSYCLMDLGSRAPRDLFGKAAWVP